MVSSFAIKKNELVQCIELNTGRNCQATFQFSNKKITTNVFSFQDYLHIDPDSPIFLESEKAKIISLFQSFSSGAGNTHNGYTDKTVHKQLIYSNCALIGDIKWLPEMKVKRVNFRIPGTAQFFHNFERLRSLSTSKYSETDFDLFMVSSKVARIRAGYVGKGSIWHDGLSEIDCAFEIELNDPTMLGGHLNLLHAFEWFFSCSLGHLLKSTDRSISPQSTLEFLKAVDEHELPIEHIEVRPSIPAKQIPSHISYHGSPVWGNSHEEIDTLKVCLVAWLDRLDVWNDAYVHMVACLRKTREISSERLLSACKWLERIPSAKHEEVHDLKTIAAMATLACNAALENGRTFEEDRVRNLLRPLMKETHGERFCRLLQDVWSEGHLDKSTDIFIADLKRSQLLRGEAAHNYSKLQDDHQFIEFARSIYALEALCFLLTMRDLPWSDLARSRLMGHPMIENYVNCL